MRGILIGLRCAFVLLAFVEACTSAAPARDTPHRVVVGNVVSSSADPAVRIEVPKQFSFIGTDSWLLYGIANCRLFVFAEAGAHRAVRRLYWIQFESYVPSMPKLHHLYSSTRHVTLGGLDFLSDTWIAERGKPTTQAADLAGLERYLRSNGYGMPARIDIRSDSEHVGALLSAKHLRLPPVAGSVRLVHLVDPAARKELMIIYKEDITATQLQPSDTKKGASGYARWKRIEAVLLRKAEADAVITQK